MPSNKDNGAITKTAEANNADTSNLPPTAAASGNAVIDLPLNSELEYKRELRGIICTLCGTLMLYLMLASMLNLDLLEHSPYDSYTLQAMTWRSGHIKLSQNYPWLELAIYNGDYYVSFPPFPTVIMLALTVFFDENTPSMLVNLVLFLCSSGIAYLTLRHFDLKPEIASIIAVFCVCGCNLQEVSLYGGVWNIAQGCSFFLTSASLYAMQSPREAHNVSAMVLGTLCIAFAVGCRPFQAIYVPYVLYKLYWWCREDENTLLQNLLRMVPYCILPGLIAIAYGTYNYVRFDNIFEFGHNYIPEFSTEGGSQFSISHWPQNVKNIFRLPYFDENRLVFPNASGFAFYICNPMFVIALIETVRRAIKRQFDAEDALFLAAAFIHFNLLLLHGSFGGVQFGTRYLIDLLPSLAVFTFRKKQDLTTADILLMLWGIAFNAYGTVVMHILN